MSGDSTNAGTIRLADIRQRDPGILADPLSQKYYLIGSSRGSVAAYTSRDLKEWTGPEVIFMPPTDIWGDIPVVGIWAPEMHYYQNQYCLLLTFDTRNLFAEQWRNWLPRVTRGSAVLVSDAPTGPFVPLKNCATTPTDMMTLDGTLWMEDGVPYMVFCHEWVQITNGSVAYIGLTEDLTDTLGSPTVMFWGSEAPWSRMSRKFGCYVTDGPSLYRSTSGSLFMIWSSGGDHGYTTGIAVSESGRLAGPWAQQAEPLYTDDGGHGQIFTTFDGKLMMVLHSPNALTERPRLFEMRDTGETLVIVQEFLG